MPYLGRAESIRGEGHIDRNLPLQDASGHVETKDYAIAVVADGHGGERYIRSAIGASIAVNSSIETLERYMSNWNDFKERMDNDPDATLTSICNSMIANWHKGIEEYDAAHPLNDDEMRFISERNIMIKDWETMYGTTLVISVMTDGLSYGIQLGDGSLVTMDDSGEVNMPMPDDDHCVGNITTSMCSPKASEYIRYYYRDDIVSSLVCTDGFETSFISNESFQRQCRSMMDMMKNDVDSAWDRIKEDMIQRSRSNHCDDVSISIISKISIHHDGTKQECHRHKNHRAQDKRKMRGRKNKR